MTAYTLQKMVGVPFRMTLFEASERLGGKILTPQFHAAPVRYEAGAAEFYDYSLFDVDPLKELIAELGLPIAPMGGPTVIMKDHMFSNMDDLTNQLGPRAAHAVRDFDRMARDRMTPEEFFHSDDPEGLLPPAEKTFETMLSQIQDPNARQYIETMMHSDLATEPSLTSLGYGLQNYLMNDPAYMLLYGIAGGNERLPNELAQRIQADFRLDHRVANVRKSGDKLRIESIHRGEVKQDDFDFVVMALPHSHLNSVQYLGDRLSRAMQRHHDQYNYPAHYLRITLLFDRPFWRASCTDSYWMLDRFGGCCLYDESSRDPSCDVGILGWLLAGDAAQQMNACSDDELVAEALKSLPAIMAPEHSRLLEGRVHRWIGAVNAIPGGCVPTSIDRRHQPEPIEHPNLFVVGDYLFDSTLNGVLDSAQYVASWLAAELTERFLPVETMENDDSRKLAAQLSLDRPQPHTGIAQGSPD